MNDQNTTSARPLKPKPFDTTDSSNVSSRHDSLVESLQFNVEQAQPFVKNMHILAMHVSFSKYMMCR